MSSATYFAQADVPNRRELFRSSRHVVPHGMPSQLEPLGAPLPAGATHPRGAMRSRASTLGPIATYGKTCLWNLGTSYRRQALFVCEGSPAQPPNRKGTLVTTTRMEVRSALGPAITRAGGILILRQTRHPPRLTAMPRDRLLGWQVAHELVRSSIRRCANPRSR